MRSAARVHGVTVLDMRHAEAACQNESAVCTVGMCEELNGSAQRSVVAHARLESSCDAVDLPCATRLLRGDPRQLLPRESQFHDLVVAAVDDRTATSELATATTLAELADLVRRGVQPLLAVRRQRRLPSRVLLAFDGSAAAVHTIRTFLNLGLLPAAECRLLVTGPNAAAARQSFDDMAEYCFVRRPDIETGWTVGPLMRVLPAAAKKWQADLVVTRLPNGMFRLPPWTRTLARLQRDLPRCAFFFKA
jgi:hypothetical protein